MWMNLDQLPAGKSMFTVYVTLDPKGTPRDEMGADEVDVVAPSSASRDAIINDGAVHPKGENAGAFIREMYGLDSRVVGVVNQSEGYIVYDAFEAGDEG